MIPLTRSEFSQFNLKSKIKILRKDGKLIKRAKLGPESKLLLFTIYGFYVQCETDPIKDQIRDISLVISNNWIDHIYSIE